MLTADDTISLSERLAPPLERGERAFRIALLVAFLCHAALFVEMARSVPRTIGSEDGRPDAISVELISAADLQSRETVVLPPPGAAQAAGAPPPPQPQPQPQQDQQPPPDQQQQAQPEPPRPETPADAQPQSKPPPVAEPVPEPQPAPAAEKAATLPELLKELPDLATIENPERTADPAARAEPADSKSEPEQKSEPTKTAEREPAERKAPPTPAKKKPAPQARLDLGQPEVSQSPQLPPGGRSAAATRPPGITRSGENDDFGRAVVRALRGTMPPPDGALGQVTVRLLLTENGDLADVRVLQGSGRSRLDESVVFATRQTYFPLPPYRSTVADRTFTIRYVYR